MTEKKQYYCGSWWTPRFIRKILSFRFNASCKIHDLDYASKEFDREEADTRFLLHMVRQSKGSFFFELIATVFYIFVRMLGKLSYGVNKAKKILTKSSNDTIIEP
tara:strand:+ start:119 stop:433 length:315 start_codon:yes stop_codon:yes gene_type:complete